jgi:hypothetical protein
MQFWTVISLALGIIMRSALMAMAFLLLVVGCTQQSAETAGVDQDKAVSIAKELAQSSGRDLTKYAEPKCELDPDQNDWRLTFTGTEVPSPGNYFTVVVNAKTGKAVLIPGE